MKTISPLLPAEAPPRARILSVSTYHGHERAPQAFRLTAPFRSEETLFCSVRGLRENESESGGIVEDASGMNCTLRKRVKIL